MGSAIPRIHAPTYDQFVSRYLYPRRPVVIENALNHWTAMREWTPGYFRREFPEVEVSITPRHGAAQRYRIRELIDLVEQSSPDHPAPYLRNEVVSHRFPRLQRDFTPLPAYGLPNWLAEPYLLRPLQREFNRGAQMELFIGGKGAGFPRIHYDYLGTHAFLIQVYGEKRVIFFPPDQSACLYPDPGGGTYSLIDDPGKVDLQRFPLFAQATPLETTLGPGDLLFVPSMWWHTTRMTSASISLSFNLLNGSNWRQMTDYLCRRRSRVVTTALRPYLHLAGHWRQQRDRAQNPQLPLLGGLPQVEPAGFPP